MQNYTLFFYFLNVSSTVQNNSFVFWLTLENWNSFAHLKKNCILTCKCKRVTHVNDACHCNWKWCIEKAWWRHFNHFIFFFVIYCQFQCSAFLLLQTKSFAQTNRSVHLNKNSVLSNHFIWTTKIIKCD